MATMVGEGSYSRLGILVERIRESGIYTGFAYRLHCLLAWEPQASQGLGASVSPSVNWGWGSGSPCGTREPFLWSVEHWHRGRAETGWTWLSSQRCLQWDPDEKTDPDSDCTRDGAWWGWLGSRALGWRGLLECLTLESVLGSSLLPVGLKMEWDQEEILF